MAFWPFLYILLFIYQKCKKTHLSVITALENSHRAPSRLLVIAQKLLKNFTSPSQLDLAIPTYICSLVIFYNPLLFSPFPYQFILIVPLIVHFLADLLISINIVRFFYHDARIPHFNGLVTRI